MKLRHALIPASLLLASVPAHAQEPLVTAQLQGAVAALASGELKSYYAYHERPLWVRADGTLDPAAEVLLRLVETAELDGLDPARLGAGELRAAIAAARADASQAALAQAELSLSTTLANYVQAMTSGADDKEMLYEHEVLRPITPTSLTVLRGAAEAPVLSDYLRTIGWMHPLYGELRQSLLQGEYPPELRQAAVANLRRIGAIPAPPWERHVVIDAASATLWMYEGGRVVDSMKVVVGKADTQTPLMSGYIRYAMLNPYWNVPDDLVRKTIAPNVINLGVRYLKTRGYEVLSGWEDDAELLDPSKINWQAVRKGEVFLRVRQRPGGTNAMGDVKFEFPNPQGIYLHDTPDMQLMKEDARQFSNGCVRLEDAERFGRWLFEGAMPDAGEFPEQRVNLDQPVPIFITYLTVRPQSGQVALGGDPYRKDGHDVQALAGL